MKRQIWNAGDHVLRDTKGFVRTIQTQWSIGMTHCHLHPFLLLLQSALQPLWVMAWSTIVEYSQQEGFYRVLLPAARPNPNLEDQWLECSNSRQQVSLTSETTRANPQQLKVELWARKLPRILPRVATSTSLFGSFTCRKFMTWTGTYTWRK